MFPRMVEMIAVILATPIMAYPLAAVVHVGAIGMARPINIASAILAALSTPVLTLVRAILALLGAIWILIPSIVSAISVAIPGLAAIRLWAMRWRGVAILLIVTVLWVLCPEGDSECEEGRGPYEAMRHE